MKYKHLFGPVASRRLGTSLGVDLVPHKVCTLDCLYCECGKTTELTLELKEYIPIKEVVKELHKFLKSGPKLDYITFSGNGEPTLNSGIGKVITFLKKEFPNYKIALITNGTLLYQPKVLDNILDLDLIIPSIDAISEKNFKKINRPHPDLSIKNILNGICTLSKKFKGSIYLEIFIIPKINDTSSELALIKEFIPKINPKKIQLNSLDRPGTSCSVEKAKRSILEEVKTFLGFDTIEIIGEIKDKKNNIGANSYLNSNSTDDQSLLSYKILNTIERRPCTKEELSDMLKISNSHTQEIIDQLIKSEKIIPEKGERGDFYRVNKLQKN